jgi:hypothetical protein
VDAAHQELEIYRKIRIPSGRDDELRLSRLEALTKHAQGFSNAVGKLDDATEMLLVQTLWYAGGKRGEIPQSKSVAVVGAEARRLGEAAKLLHDKTRRSPGRKQDQHLSALIASLAKTYEDLFGKRPSAAKNGIFARVIDDILIAASIDSEIGETRLKNIFDQMIFAAPQSKRGRKSRGNCT